MLNWNTIEQELINMERNISIINNNGFVSRNVNKVFHKELQQISIYSDTVSNYTKRLLHKLPIDRNFYYSCASTTKVHHPETSNVVGGQIIHVKSAFWIGNELIKSTWIGDELTNIQKACILGAILLHDIDKFNESTEDHGVTGALKILSLINEFENQKIIYYIGIGVRYHMGKFGSAIAENDNLGKPELLIAHVVHQCDFLSSREFLLFDYGIILCQ